MELTYMDGDNERQWLAQANSELRSKLRAIQQVLVDNEKAGSNDFESLMQIERIVSS